ncbi:hypothetical protein FUAX_44290 (plasmid) [Fulvitalea axinellae]|uniref:HTH marR-type domain-containing protein n=1 Tax=Fulvitalea axinellae TaxID=1182444 RepID=A0AAU9CVN0_9BACT|nr:hypothetical protein FUAX_44290 [Fulvitalea axinellae]
MAIYSEQGELLFGTYLKRIATRFQQDVVRIYASQGIRFDLSWFPIFFLLKDGEQYAVTELAKAVDISHPALNQILKALEKEGLVVIEKDPDDLRRRLVSLNDKGLYLNRKIQPIWQGIRAHMAKMIADIPDGDKLFGILNALEEKMLADNSLFENVTKGLSQTTSTQNENV